MFQECFKEVSGKPKGCFTKVSRVFELRLKGVSSNYYISEVSKVFQGCSKKVFGIRCGSFKGVSRKFQGCLN